jgi:hypothetical protein
MRPSPGVSILSLNSLTPTLVRDAILLAPKALMSRAGPSKAQNLVLPQFLRADKDARHTMDELECSLVTALPALPQPRSRIAFASLRLQ